MSERKPRLSRRDAFLALGAVGTTAAAAAVAARTSVPLAPAQPAPAAERRPGEWRETAHMARYYRSTRI